MDLLCDNMFAHASSLEVSRRVLYELYGRDFSVINSVITSIIDKTHVSLRLAD